ncbi:hypothetical protein [Flavitalea sp.]|nr:hypothetical protein [Flavitalea sp.]
MHRLHSGLTVAVAIKDGRSPELRALLRSLNNSIAKSEARNTNHHSNEPLPQGTDTNSPAEDSDQHDNNNKLCDFENSETTLVVSGVILPVQNYNGETLPSTLVFATTYSGPLKKHLEELVKTSKTGLCQIFKNCVGFPDGESINDDALISFIKSHSQGGAFGSRYTCITKQDVKNEKELRKEIEDYLDNVQESNSTVHKKALDVKTLIQLHLKSRGDKFKWAMKPARDNLVEFLSKNRAFILVGFLALAIIATTVIINRESSGWPMSILLGIAVLIAVIAVTIIVGFGMIYFIARSKHNTADRPPDDHVRQVTATQLRPIINEMTAAAPLKKGALRRAFYSTALKIINLHSCYLMKVPTVSSLRWLAIDNHKRLLFLSNYSNTTDFYVREFLNGKTPEGVNFMFTHGEGFPDAKYLRKGGITEDPEGYMNVIHTHQHPTDLWYVHDSELTIDQILRNRQIRNGLYKEMNEQEALNWLRLL